MQITPEQFNTFVAVLKDMEEHGMKITDWDNHGNIELQWSDDGINVERAWHTQNYVANVIEEIKENLYLGKY